MKEAVDAVNTYNDNVDAYGRLIEMINREIPIIP